MWDSIIKIDKIKKPFEKSKTDQLKLIPVPNHLTSI